jgi:hypothetical protein
VVKEQFTLDLTSGSGDFVGGFNSLLVDIFRVNLKGLTSMLEKHTLETTLINRHKKQNDKRGNKENDLFAEAVTYQSSL